MGDPLGIGPEVVVKALPRLTRAANMILFGQRDVLECAAKLSGISLSNRLEIREPRKPLRVHPTKKECGTASLAPRALQDDGPAGC